MKKVFGIMLATALIFTGAFAFTGCSLQCLKGHTLDTVYEADKHYHYVRCLECNEKINMEEHNHDSYCGICGYKADPSFTVSVFEGEAGSLPAIEESTLVISSAAELAAFRDSVNSGNSFRGINIRLAENIDLNNILWEPIGRSNSISFQGHFDGDGHIIYNLNTEVADFSGLFGCVAWEGSIKNLSIVGANIKSTHYSGAIVAYIQSCDSNHRTVVDNCHAQDAFILCENVGNEFEDEGTKSVLGDKAGALIGYAVRTDIIGCTVSDCMVSAARDAGKLIGHLNSGSEMNYCFAYRTTVVDNNGVQNPENNDNVRNELNGR